MNWYFAVDRFALRVGWRREVAQTIPEPITGYYY